MAGSMLHAIDAHQGITDSLQEYVETGTALANQPEAYAAYRKHFTQDAWMHTAGNIDRFTREFEARLTDLVSGRFASA